MSEIDPFAGLTSFPTAKPTGPESLEQSGMGRDAFLKIFLTQLAHQDPLEPQDASELGAQLAVFSQVEQQTLMAEELRGVNTRLDTLIEAAGGRSAALEPVSLIGKQVQVLSPVLQSDAQSNSTDALRFEIAKDGVQSLLIAGETESGGVVGLAALGVQGGATQLARGTYELRFAAGELQLVMPDGSVRSGESLPLVPFVRDAATGQLRAVAAGEPGSPQLVGIAPGAAHEFTLATRDASSAYTPLTSYRAGAVSSVRIADGKQVVTVNGVDVDPSKIIRVQ
jgi:hypothetical protein